jgi:hypothetical protein
LWDVSVEETGGGLQTLISREEQEKDDAEGGKKRGSSGKISKY